jgi:signal peptidase
LAILLYGTQLIGLKPYSVLSGSMERVYPTGSLIYVVKTNPEKLLANDVITFKLQNGTVATHRIIELVSDETNTVRFRTKGDENEIADGTLVDFKSVIGKPLFCIPFLGFLATFLTYPAGKLMVFAAFVVLMIIEILCFFISKKIKKET